MNSVDRFTCSENQAHLRRLFDVGTYFLKGAKEKGGSYYFIPLGNDNIRGRCVAQTELGRMTVSNYNPRWAGNFDIRIFTIRQSPSIVEAEGLGQEMVIPIQAASVYYNPTLNVYILGAGRIVELMDEEGRKRMKVCEMWEDLEILARADVLAVDVDKAMLKSGEIIIGDLPADILSLIGYPFREYRNVPITHYDLHPLDQVRRSYPILPNIA